MCRISRTASINFLSYLILEEIHEFTCHDGGAYGISLFLSETPHRVKKKFRIISIQINDTRKVGVPGDSQDRKSVV